MRSLPLIALLAGCPGPTTEPTDPADCTPLAPEDVREGGTLSGCYTVESGLYIEGDLVVEAGSTFVMAPDSFVQVELSGSLAVNGTSEEGVVFRGEDSTPGSWYGIGYIGSPAPANTLAHTTVEGACSGAWNGAGESVGGVFVEDDGRLTVESLTVSGCPGVALHIWEPIARVTVDGLVTLDVDMPVRLPAVLAPGLGGSLDLAGTDGTVHLSDGFLDEATALPPLDYTVEDTLRAEGVDLTLAAGSTLRFALNTGIDVYDGGSFSAEGTAEAPIVLQGVEALRGTWLGVHLYVSNSTDNVMRHVTIDGAGSEQWHGGERSRAGLYLEGDEVRLTVSDTTIRNCEGPAVSIDGEDPAGKIAISDSTFTDCEESALVSPDASSALDASVVLTGNDADHVRIAHLQSGSDWLSESVTWPARDVPYYVDDTVYVSGSLTIEPGATVVFDDDQGISVGNWPASGGTITIGGTGDPVLLTGESAVAGAWRGISIYGSLTNTITNTRIEYAGSSQWTGATESQAAVYLEDDAALDLTDTVFANNEGGDAYADYDSVITGCTGVVGTVLGDVDATVCTP
ncbi:MAG: hypothetical protein H6736_10280 [Alphaproteobacteria bacterium]|nr:hypothetical protein [Alphaproteobacteria bacterium]MCB9692187.1 hypothetical protein [Alphaproteobacteria bacterium]